MKNIQFNKPGKLKKWSFLAIRDAEARLSNSDYKIEQVTTAVGGLTNALRSTGVDLTEHSYLDGQELLLDLEDGPDSALEAKFARASEALDLLLVILPGTKKTEPFNEQAYRYIKILGDIKYGIRTICVLGDKFKNNNSQYFGNVALKFNLTLGGINQIVEQQRLSFIKEGKTMLVGLDVTHPSSESALTAPSLAGMVASTDKHLGQWPATLRRQMGRQEMVSDLGDMLKTHLVYRRTLGKHSSFPENIIVYRDGVSEGQYDDVLQKELPLLRRACKEMYPTGLVCNLSFMVFTMALL